MRHSDAQSSPAALELREVYRAYALAAAAQEQEIKGVIALLRKVGIEPLLAKGWAVAGLYADTSLRPPGDIDLCIRPRDSSHAEAVLDSPDGEKYFVDTWHEEYDMFDDHDWDNLYARSQLVTIDDTEVRVLGPEDHLAFLCLHLLRHGAWRPLWLCDVAAALESRPADFDWDACLGSDRRRADSIACAIGLAHQLVGAQLNDTPVASRARHLPSWLVPAVLRQWEGLGPEKYLAPHLIRHSLRHPMCWPRAARERWPDPVQATIRINGPFNELPRFPFQLAEYCVRLGKFLARLPRLLRERD